MSENIVVTFALLFGATIALICAVYLAIGTRRKRIERQKQLESE